MNGPFNKVADISVNLNCLDEALSYHQLILDFHHCHFSLAVYIAFEQ